MGTFMTAVNIDTNAIRDFCQKYHIRRLSLFGSALRGELGPDSDIDLLVEFQQGRSPGYFSLAAMERELAAIVGRTVDLRTAGEISLRFRDEVVRTAREIYAA